MNFRNNAHGKRLADLELQYYVCTSRLLAVAESVELSSHLDPFNFDLNRSKTLSLSNVTH